MLGPAFPVLPVDLSERARIEQLLCALTDAGASVVTLPELSVTPALAAELEDTTSGLEDFVWMKWLR